MMDLARKIKNYTVNENHLAVWWLGMAGFAFKTKAGRTFLVDPYLSDFVPDPPGWTRRDSPPLDPREANADIVLFTHEDFDHFDPISIPILASRLPDLHFVGPLACWDELQKWGILPDRIVKIDIGQTIDLETIRVKAVFARHSPSSVGLIIDFKPGRVYMVGDTLWDERLLEVKEKLDFMAVPITPMGSHNLKIWEAVDLVSSLRPNTVIPCHYGTFDVFDSNPHEFVNAVRAREPKVNAVILEPGENYEFPIDVE